MKIINKIFVQKDFKFCDKAFPTDIGFDVKAIKDPEIVGNKIGSELYSSIDYIEYDTGITIDPMQRNGEENIFALLFPRSSISSKTNLILANSIGLIDPSYRQSLKFRFKYIFQPEDLVSVADKFAIKINEKKLYKVGERIGQTVFVRNLNVEFNYVEQLIGSARSGFGSTGD